MSTDYINSSNSNVSRESLDSQTSYKASEYFPCAHAKVIHHKSRTNCYTCGLFLHDQAKAYKSPKMKYGTYFDPIRFYSSTLKSRLPKIVISPESEFYKHRPSLLDLIGETSEKLQLAPNTTHLAVMFMDFTLSRVQSIPVSQYQAYAATCVMLAAKSIELDEHIPFISKLIRYSGLTSYKPKDFSSAEQIILRELNWTLQNVTTIDVVEYYLSQGIVFSSDTQVLDDNQEDNTLKEKNNFTNDSTPSTFPNCRNNQKYSANKVNDENKDFSAAFNQLSLGKKETSFNSSVISNKKKINVSEMCDSRIFQIVQKIEKDYLRLVHMISRDNRFYEFDLKVLSAACVAFLRKVNGLPEWCKQLSIISNYQVTESSIIDCLSILECRFKSILYPQVTPAKRNSILSSNSSSTLLRDCENQNKPPTNVVTPQKYIFKNNMSSQSSAKNQTSDYQVHKASSSFQKPLPFNHTSDASHISQFTIPSNPVLQNKTNYQQYNSNLGSICSNSIGMPPINPYQRSNTFQGNNTYHELMRFGSNLL